MNNLAGLALALSFSIAGYAAGAYFQRFAVADVLRAFRDLALHFRTSSDPDVLHQRNRQLSIILHAAGPISLANVLNIAIVASLLWQSTNNVNVAIWAFTMAMMAIFHSLEVIKLTSNRVRVSRPDKKVMLIIRNVSIFGLMWGSASLLFSQNATDPESFIVALALVGTAAGGAAAMAAIPPAALLFVSTIAGPVLTRFIFYSPDNSGPLALYTMSLVFVLGAVSSGVFEAAIKESPPECGASQKTPVEKDGLNNSVSLNR